MDYSESCSSQTKENINTNSLDETFSKFRKRPSLVKQKQSFRFPDEESELEGDEMGLKSKSEEVEDEGKPGFNVGSQESEVLKAQSSRHDNERDGNVIETSNTNNLESSANGEKDTARQVPPNPFLKRISFEDLKEEVKLMPTFPPPDFVRTGSDDSGTGCSGTRPGSRAQTR